MPFRGRHRRTHSFVCGCLEARHVSRHRPRATPLADAWHRQPPRLETDTRRLAVDPGAERRRLRSHARSAVVRLRIFHAVSVFRVRHSLCAPLSRRRASRADSRPPARPFSRLCIRALLRFPLPHGRVYLSHCNLSLSSRYCRQRQPTATATLFERSNERELVT